MSALGPLGQPQPAEPNNSPDNFLKLPITSTTRSKTVKVAVTVLLVASIGTGGILAIFTTLAIAAAVGGSILGVGGSFLAYKNFRVIKKEATPPVPADNQIPQGAVEKTDELAQQQLKAQQEQEDFQKLKAQREQEAQREKEARKNQLVQSRNELLERASKFITKMQGSIYKLRSNSRMFERELLELQKKIVSKKEEFQKNQEELQKQLGHLKVLTKDKKSKKKFKKEINSQVSEINNKKLLLDEIQSEINNAEALNEQYQLNQEKISKYLSHFDNNQKQLAAKRKHYIDIPFDFEKEAKVQEEFKEILLEKEELFKDLFSDPIVVGPVVEKPRISEQQVKQDAADPVNVSDKSSDTSENSSSESGQDSVVVDREAELKNEAEQKQSKELEKARKLMGADQPTGAILHPILEELKKIFVEKLGDEGIANQVVNIFKSLNLSNVKLQIEKERVLLILDKQYKAKIPGGDAHLMKTVAFRFQPRALDIEGIEVHPKLGFIGVGLLKLSKISSSEIGKELQISTHLHVSSSLNKIRNKVGDYVESEFKNSVLYSIQEYLQKLVNFYLENSPEIGYQLIGTNEEAVLKLKEENRKKTLSDMFVQSPLHKNVCEVVTKLIDERAADIFKIAETTELSYQKFCDLLMAEVNKTVRNISEAVYYKDAIDWPLLYAKRFGEKGLEYVIIRKFQIDSPERDFLPPGLTGLKFT